MNVINKQVYRWNTFIAGLLILTSAVLVYFLYQNQRSKSLVYVSVSLTRPTNIQLNIASNSVPYWVAEAVSAGDQEKTFTGAVLSEVVDKDVVDSYTFGKTVNLLLKINAIRDRSGVYLYKNKPLLVGGNIDLKLNKSQVQGIVTAIDTQIPKSETKAVTVTLRGNRVESWLAENLEINDSIKNDKGEEVAKIINKRIYRNAVSELRTGTGNSVYLNTDLVDIELTVRLVVEEISGSYYFAKLQRVKLNESLYLPFTSGAVNFPVSGITDQSGN